MEIINFNNQAGELKDAIYNNKQCFAFIPFPLPISYQPKWSIVEKFRQASIWLERFNIVGDDRFAVKRLSRALVRREAAASAGIEGTVGGTIDMCIYEVEGQRWLFGPNRVNPGINNLKELSNSFVALTYSLTQTGKDISLNLLCECQKKLVEGVNPIKDPKPGYLREEQVIIGKEGAPAEDAIFVPPPPHLVPELINNLIDYLNSKQDSLPSLFKVALAHYYFEAIHPFRDGNGRTGRILIQFLLHKWGICKVPGLTLARFFELHNDEYRKKLLLVSQQGDYDGWFEFFFDGMIYQVREDIAFMKSLDDLKDKWDGRIDLFYKVHKMRKTDNLSLIIDFLSSQPYFTRPMILKALKIRSNTISDILKKLIDIGIVSEVGNGIYGTIYKVDDVLNVMES